MNNADNHADQIHGRGGDTKVAKKQLQDSRKAFIINFIYFIIIGGILYFVMKRMLPMFGPFIFGFIVAAILSPIIKKITSKIKIPRTPVAIVTLLVFYGVILVLIWFFGSRVMSFIQDQAGRLPAYYGEVIEPQIRILFDKVVLSFPDYQDRAVELFQSLENSIQTGIMNISASLIGWGASLIVGFPALLVQFIFMIISSFFFTIDFERILSFILRQFREERREMIVEIVSSGKVVIIKIIRVYALLMTITFIEVYIGFSILKMPMTLLLAFLVALVDILPVLGTGTVLIPWGIILCVIGETALGLGILALYLFVTVVRQTLEPKIIGQQVGLHPIVTLLCIFAGAQLLGIIGIFMFPVIATVIKKMNDKGTIHLFR